MIAEGVKGIQNWIYTKKDINGGVKVVERDDQDNILPKPFVYESMTRYCHKKVVELVNRGIWMPEATYNKFAQTIFALQMRDKKNKRFSDDQASNTESKTPTKQSTKQKQKKMR